MEYELSETVSEGFITSAKWSIISWIRGKLWNFPSSLNEVKIKLFYHTLRESPVHWAQILFYMSSWMPYAEDEGSDSSSGKKE